MKSQLNWAGFFVHAFSSAIDATWLESSAHPQLPESSNYLHLRATDKLSSEYEEQFLNKVALVPYILELKDVLSLQI